MAEPTPTHTWWWLCGASLVVGAACLLEYQPPDRVLLPWIGVPLPDTCWSRRWLGFSCPGCGLTRSFILAAHGAWGEAFSRHAPGTLLFVLLLLQFPLRLLQMALGFTIPAKIWIALLGGLFLWSLILWMLRIL